MPSNQNFPSHLRRKKIFNVLAGKKGNLEKSTFGESKTAVHSKTILLNVFLRQYDNNTEDVLLLLIQR
jgi:hypothetical protein